MFCWARVIAAGVAGIAGAMTGGCAYVTAVPVPQGAPVEGIRIYEAKPILIVTGSTVRVEIIPNPNRAYALKFGAFLAKHDLIAGFQNGMLTTLTSNQDTTKIIDLLARVAERAIPSAGVGTSTGTAGGAPERFGVYEFVFDDIGNLVALRPLIGPNSLVRVPRDRRGATDIPANPVRPAAGADSIDAH